MGVTFNEYQDWTETKARPGGPERRVWDALGLAGEAGEFCDLLKKEMAHCKSPTPTEYLSELGDVLYYVARCASHLGYTMHDVAYMNMQKLNGRYPNGFEASRAYAPGEAPAEG